VKRAAEGSYDWLYVLDEAGRGVRHQGVLCGKTVGDPSRRLPGRYASCGTPSLPKWLTSAT